MQKKYLYVHLSGNYLYVLESEIITAYEGIGGFVEMSAYFKVDYDERPILIVRDAIEAQRMYVAIARDEYTIAIQAVELLPFFIMGQELLESGGFELPPLLKNAHEEWLESNFRYQKDVLSSFNILF